MDRLTLTLFGLDREQEAAIKELFEARGWDYVHDISLPFLYFVETFLARNSFVQPFFATDDTTVVHVEPETERQGDSCDHTPIIAFRHLSPKSARFSYATEGALFIFAQLSTDAVSALRKVWVLIGLWKQHSVQART